MDGAADGAADGLADGGGSGKYRKTTPSAQYRPASLPPAITEVKRAKLSGVGKRVCSIITISLKGSYLMEKLLLLITKSTC